MYDMDKMKIDEPGSRNETSDLKEGLMDRL